ncbi:MAG: tetratricopeptide repeat protein, partial [Synergistaceae bacterium]|nr:tetratricopeptide repeat protein [Synergistaceae bacterium]
MTDRNEKKLTGRLTAIFLIAIFCFSLVLSSAPDVSYADSKSPPDESIRTPEDENKEREEQKRREEDARIARQKSAEAARRRAAEAARRKAEAEKKAKAERDAESARRLASEDMVRRPIIISQNLVENGRYRSAVHLLRGYLDANRESAEGWYLISRAYHALGDYDRAQIAVNNALEIDPYYPDLVKTPNGVQPMPVLTKEEKREPRPSMSVLPVKQPLPANLLLEPVTISFPILVEAEYQARDGYANSMYEPDGRDPITGAYLQYAPQIPMPLGATVRWMQSEQFNEISRWRFRVDRMGILMEPRVPVAWKGDNPYEVYFWAGTEWARVRRKKGGVFENSEETYDDILYSA